MDIHEFNPDLPIHGEAAILRRLDKTPAHALFVRALRELAWKGERLRKRYENSCSYQWATTPSYAARTETVEKEISALARDADLSLYLQTDPRGACVYVAWEPLSDQNYSSRGQALFYGEDE